ncbi:MarR family winged helix-turn-helix transcriptional regulator [Nocardia wallacei]|uniref:MarR family winged helix-turn-helix transcriptional regulator n=1 Tax=Nocardia wallacei TaxID=480035 RepID=UPI00245499B2|nr:MarR family winged helix-turn-helix transcriptional regulator [Nocardia wallacei]
MPNPTPPPDLPTLLLAAAADVTDALRAGVAAAGFADVRPAHGFAFARMAAGGATVGEIAAHLGVTKQAASQLVEDLVLRGYAQRNPHPHDARARLITLTDRGRAAARATEAAAAEFTARWVAGLGEQRASGLREALAGMVTPRRGAARAAVSR